MFELLKDDAYIKSNQLSILKTEFNLFSLFMLKLTTNQQSFIKPQIKKIELIEMQKQNKDKNKFEHKQQQLKQLLDLQKFHGYPSIEQANNTKIIKMIQKANLDDKSILWIATEKVHGSNFSIHYSCENDKIRYGRRNDFLTDQIPVNQKQIKAYFKEPFYNVHEVVGKFHQDLLQVKKNILKTSLEAKKFIIYGQFFGGFWPQKVQNPKQNVQKGIYYTYNHEIWVFDIKIITDEHVNWVQVLDIQNIIQKYIPTVPIYAKGTFDQMMSIQMKFDSTIPQILGFKKIQDNVCQGLVVRPNKNNTLKVRVILKRKNKQFLEKTGIQTKQKIKKQIQAQTVPYIQQLQQYLNKNRVQSSISKYPDFKDRYHLKGYVYADIMEDAQKDGYVDPQCNQLQKKVKREFDKTVLQFVNSYLNQQQRKN